MQSRWNDSAAQDWYRSAGDDPADRDLALRVYTSRLIGSDSDLVLHGGGNTSVKTQRPDAAGALRDVIHVKGSGWDLGNIEAPGLPALELAPLLQVRAGGGLDDLAMVKLLRGNLIEENAPNPSVETLLHAFLPAKFVDHSHATAVLVLANQPDSAEIAGRLYGDRLAIVPYVMPGFDLSLGGARAFDDTPGCEGLWLVNHGLFTFGESAQQSYERMIEFVGLAEQHLESRGINVPGPQQSDRGVEVIGELAARLEAALSAEAGPFAGGVALDFRSTPTIREFVSRADLDEIASRGPVTPDHVIRTKPFPLIVEHTHDANDIQQRLETFKARYRSYFERNAARATEQKVMLDPLPRLILVRGHGLIGLGRAAKEAAIVADLSEQSARIITAAEEYGRFTPISVSELFDMEYWSLEQAKLGSARDPAPNSATPRASV